MSVVASDVSPASRRLAGAPADRPRARPTPAATATAAGLAGLSALTVVPTVLSLFAGGGAAGLLLAGVLPAVVAALSVGIAWSNRRPWAPLSSPWLRLFVDAVAVLLLVAFLPSGPQGQSALAGLPSGLHRLLTSALPVGAGGPELGVAVVAVALASGVGAELALRPGRRLLPLAPAAVLYVAAVAIGAGGQPAPPWGALLFLGWSGIVVLALRDGPAGEGPTAGADRRGPGAGAPVAAGAFWCGPSAGPGVAHGDRALPKSAADMVRTGQRWPRLLGSRWVAGTAVLAVVVAAALPLGVHLPGAENRRPFNLRAALAPGPLLPPGVSPLDSYASVYDGPARPAFSVRTGSGDPTQLYWRLATFDHFTGMGWTSGAVFRRAGRELPPRPPLTVRTETVQADVSLAQAGPYLPAPDRPVAVSVDGLAVSGSDGSLGVPAGVASPTHYRVRSSVPVPSRAQLLTSSPVRAGDPGSPAIPPSVLSVASAAIAGAGPSPFARLTAISTYLTGPGFEHHPPGRSPIGSGTYQVLQLLRDHDGSAEQYAAAFALLARAVGFDTRLAVGYVGGTPDRSGAVQFTNRDLSVWPEVDLAGVGWLAFPATPARSGQLTPSAPDPTSLSPLSQALSEQANLNTAGKPQAAGAPARSTAPGHRGGSGNLAWLLLALALAGTAGLGGLGLVVAKARRRGRRRRRSEPAARLIGAWEQVLDRLAGLGTGVGAALTTPEVARAAGELGPSCAAPVAALGPLVDAARYDRRHQPTSASADQAWAQAGAFEQAVRATVPIRRRARAAVSLSPWLRR